MFRVEWIPRLILSSLCLIFGIRLSFAGPILAAEYASWGVPEIFMRTAGAGLILAVFGLWYPRFRIIFLLLVSCTVAASLFIHMKLNHGFWNFFPAASIGAFLLWDVTNSSSQDPV